MQQDEEEKQGAREPTWQRSFEPQVVWKIAGFWVLYEDLFTAMQTRLFNIPCYPTPNTQYIFNIAFEQQQRKTPIFKHHVKATAKEPNINKTCV